MGGSIGLGSYWRDRKRLELEIEVLQRERRARTHTHTHTRERKAGGSRGIRRSRRILSRFQIIQDIQFETGAFYFTLLLKTRSQAVILFSKGEFVHMPRLAARTGKRRRRSPSNLFYFYFERERKSPEVFSQK